MALAADHHHTHTLNFLSTGYHTKTFYWQNLQLFPAVLEAKEFGHLAHEKSVEWHKAKTVEKLQD